MKNFILIAIIAFTLPTAAQKFINPDSSYEPYTLDSPLRVFEDNGFIKNSIVGPAFYVNDSLANETILRQIDPLDIESIEVVKENVEVNGHTYRGKIMIKTKDHLKLSLISLKQLAQKHIPDYSDRMIFQIDDQVIHQDYTHYMVDEGHILKIIKSTIKMPGQENDISLIKIITKSPANIKEANQIMIR